MDHQSRIESAARIMDAIAQDIDKPRAHCWAALESIRDCAIAALANLDQTRDQAITQRAAITEEKQARIDARLKAVEAQNG